MTSFFKPIQKLGRAALRRRLGAFASIVLAMFLVLGAGFLLLPDFQFTFDFAQMMFAGAACLVAWTFYLWFDRRPPDSDRTVVVNYDLRISRPKLSGGRVRFELEVFYEIGEGVTRSRERQTKLDFEFHPEEHPDMLQWCSVEIGNYLASYAEIAATRYPEAAVLCAPPPRSLDPNREGDERVLEVIATAGVPLKSARSQEVREIAEGS